MAAFSAARSGLSAANSDSEDASASGQEALTALWGVAKLNLFKPSPAADGSSKGAITAAVALSSNTATATVGSTAQVDADGSVTVSAIAVDEPKTSALATTNVSNDVMSPKLTQGELSYAVTLSYAEHANASHATIDSGAVVNAGGLVDVRARTRLLHDVSAAEAWRFSDGAIAGLSTVLGAIGDANFGAEGYTSGWAQAVAAGNKKGFALSLNVTRLDNEALAHVGAGARINQDTSAFGDVAVTAGVDVRLANLSGTLDNMPSLLKVLDESLGETDPTADSVGAVMVYTGLSTLSKAEIQGGALVKADQLDVDARTFTSNVLVGAASGASTDTGMNGVVTTAVIGNTTLARVASGAKIETLAPLNVYAADDLINISAGGGITEAKIGRAHV